MFEAGTLLLFITATLALNVTPGPDVLLAAPARPVFRCSAVVLGNTSLGCPARRPHVGVTC